MYVMNAEAPQDTMGRSGGCRGVERHFREGQIMERRSGKGQIMERQVRVCRNAVWRAMEDRARPGRFREDRVKGPLGAERFMDLRGRGSGAMEDRGKEWKAMMSYPVF